MSTNALVDTRWLPARVLVTHTKGHALYRQSKESATHEANAYLSLNNSDKDGQRIFNVMMFDIDEGDALAAWQLADLPFQPRYYVGKWAMQAHGDMGLNRAHVVIQLETPVHASNRKSLKLFAVVYNEIVRRLEDNGAVVDCGTPENRGTVAAARHGQKTISKNPNAAEWDSVQGDLKAWSLYELAEALGIDPKLKNGVHTPWHRTKGVDQSRLGRSRNDDLFETARHHIYAYKSKAGSREELIEYAKQICSQVNSELFAGTQKGLLPYKEVRDTAKCIANYTWDNPRIGTGSGGKKNRGIPGAASALTSAQPNASPETLMGIGAIYVHALRAGKTHERVQECIAALREEGVEVSVSEVSRRLKMTRKTAAKYMSEDVTPSVKKAQMVEAGVRVIAPKDRERAAQGKAQKVAVAGVSNMPPQDTISARARIKNITPRGGIEGLASKIAAMEVDYDQRRAAYRAALASEAEYAIGAARYKQSLMAAHAAGQQVFIPAEWTDEAYLLRTLAGSIYDARTRFEALRKGGE